jgi:putative zinc finger/helix-turn-helix YgiT family protein
METKCNNCGGSTKVSNGQRYHYKECGLDNVYLENIELRVCESCGVTMPRLRRILDLHTTIARAVALKPDSLNGAEIRFLRKHLSLKAREWAVLLRIDHTTLSRWENGDQQVGPQSDALVRLLYFRLLEEREGRLISDPVAERIATPNKERNEEATVLINMDNPAIYSYRCA